MQFNKGFAYIIMIANGFYVTDFVILRWYITDGNPKLKFQMQVHHILAVVGYMASLFAGYGFSGVANASMLCEISGLFLNYKDMFSIESKDTTLAQLNSYAFFLTYFVFRVILFPILTFYLFKMNAMLIGLEAWYKGVLMIFVFVQAIFVLILNMFWFLIILKGVKRLLQEQGVLKKSEKDDYDEVEKYEVSQHTKLVKDDNDEDSQENKKEDRDNNYTVQNDR